MSKINMTPSEDKSITWKHINRELYREYNFLTPIGIPYTLHIDAPAMLHVSRSGGHYVIDKAGNSWYIPVGWIALRWHNEPTSPRVNFTAPNKEK